MQVHIHTHTHTQKIYYICTYTYTHTERWYISYAHTHTHTHRWYIIYSRTNTSATHTWRDLHIWLYITNTRTRCMYLYICACVCDMTHPYIGEIPPTGRRRITGCLIFIGHFSPKNPMISGSFAKIDLQLKASCESSPPCTANTNVTQFEELWGGYGQ